MPEALLRRLEAAADDGLARRVDVEFARFISRRYPESSPPVVIAAYLAAKAIGEANTCLYLPAFAAGDHEELADLQEWSGDALAEALGRSRAVGMPGDPSPLILDGQRLYLHRYWDYERRLARLLRRRIGVSDGAPSPVKVRETLERLFPASAVKPDWQKIAVAQALYRRFLVISGGPGTGKTRTVAAVMAAMLEARWEDERPVIALCAPTGKAAARLTESVKEAAAQLRLSPEVKAKFPEEAKTIHRMLGAGLSSGRFRRGPDNPIPCDVLIVDEASMVDLPLMVRLVEALRDDTVLVLLGDKDQLASVEAGSVLSDICRGVADYDYSEDFTRICADAAGEMADSSAVRGTHPLRDAIVVLTHSYRFGAESGIDRLARAVNGGDFYAAWSVLKDEGYSDAQAAVPSEMRLEELLDRVIYPGAVAAAEATTPWKALERLSKVKALCALRRGAAGVESVNAFVAGKLYRRGFCPGIDEPFRGCPLIMNRNEYAVGVFNGDMGVVWPDEETGHLKVFFEGSAAEAKMVSLSRLPAHEPAWAITVHRSQGSEYDRVVCILPVSASRIIGRELLYTAITRARKEILIWGTMDMVKRCIMQRTRRHSGLHERLWTPAD